MKTEVFSDKNIQFVPHRRHITSPLQSPASQCYVRFEIFTAVTIKNAVLCDGTRVTLVRADVSKERIASINRMTRIGELEMSAVTRNRRTLRGNYILVPLMMEVIR
jgi:hypothetical protein